MATFPSLEPLTRRYSLGAYPLTVVDYQNCNVRFLHASNQVDFTMELGFTNLSAAEALLIRTHYNGQNGDFEPFDLSVTALAGHTQTLFPSTTMWRYADAPAETQLDNGLVDVTVKLVSAAF